MTGRWRTVGKIRSSGILAFDLRTIKLGQKNSDSPLRLTLLEFKMANFLTFIARGRTFAVPADQVKELLPISSVCDLPSSSSCLRGGITVRGGVLPLFDFRALTGAQSLRVEREELVVTLNQREQDHIDWIEALQKSVKEGVEFRKATNPKACAFGKWYYSYKAPDSNIERILLSFEEPHNEIHSLAQTVLAIAGQGQQQEALRLIESAKHTTLNKLIRLFGDLRANLIGDIREIGIICYGKSGAPFALSADSVDNIRDFTREKLQCRDGLASTPIVQKIWSNEQQTILEVNMDYLNATADEASITPVDLPATL